MSESNIRGLPTLIDLELRHLNAPGRELFDDLVEDEDSPALRALALEAARMKDRCDRFDLLIVGDLDEWMTISDPGSGRDMVLKIDAVATQARLHALSLAKLVAEIAAARAGGETGEGDDSEGITDGI